MTRLADNYGNWPCRVLWSAQPNPTSAAVQAASTPSTVAQSTTTTATTTTSDSDITSCQNASMETLPGFEPGNMTTVLGRHGALTVSANQTSQCYITEIGGIFHSSFSDVISSGAVCDM